MTAPVRRQRKAASGCLADRLGHTADMWMLFAAIIVIGLVGGAIARRTVPKTYAAFNAIAWTIEGVFLAIALAGLLYQCVGGRL
jgi:Zn-dependent protease